MGESGMVTRPESGRTKRASERLPGQGPSTCAACGAELVYPVACTKCGALYRESPCQDAFTFFGIDVKFDIDPTDLERRFLELSRLLHPDKQIARQSPEPLSARKTRALVLAASMNQHYATLKAPMKRAEHLLRALGGPTADKDRRTPPNFLPEMLEVREEIEDAKAAKNRPLLETRLREFEQRDAATRDRIAKLFATPAPGALSDIRVELNAIKYFVNILDELRSALAS